MWAGLDLAVLGAELLTELDGAGGADLDALAAGDAVFLVDMGAVSRGGEVGRVEILAGAQSKADADVAVAQAEDLFGTVDVRDLVDIAVLFGALADLKRFFLRDRAALAGLDQIIGKIAQTDAAVVLDLAGTLVEETTGVAAGTIADGKVSVILVEPMRDVLDIRRLVLRGNGLFNRDDMHADAVAAGRDQVGLAFERQESHFVKGVCQLRILFYLPEHHIRHLGNAGDKQLDVPLLLVLGIFVVVLDDAVHGAVGEQLVDALLRLAGELGDLRGGFGFAKSHLEHDFCDLVVGAGTIENNVLRIGFGQTLESKLVGKAVRDHFAEIK